MTSKVDVVVVGGGQAGIAMSEHLTNFNISHVVLEKDRIAESWRTRRWDSLSTNGPAWHDRFPGLKYSKDGPDDFPKKDNVAEYFEEYVKMIKAPVETGVEVTQLRRKEGEPGFFVETTKGTWEAKSVVAATGAFQIPAFPAIVPKDTPDLLQMHSADYRNPEALPKGAVLVVGGGSSGAQIAEELALSGRKVYLSLGPHDRPPRQYRNRDFVWWLGVLNKWDAETHPGADHTTIAVSGANGGHTIDFRELAHNLGVTLLGRTETFSNGSLRFAPDLAENIAKGDANYLEMLGEADAYIARNGLNLPEEPSAREFLSLPESVSSPIFEVNLKDAGVSTIIWATGFRNDYSWMKVEALDKLGLPRHQRGVSTEPGIYFVGLPWQTRRGSSFIWGVWHDARAIAAHISGQRMYQGYEPTRSLLPK